MAVTTMPLTNAQVKNPPNTRVETSHGLTIVAKGKPVGLIQTWTPTAQTRAITLVYEINAATSGAPVATVPGNLGGYKITIGRYDLWTDRMEEVFGDEDILDSLGNQLDPFQVKETKKLPDGTSRVKVYTGCWFDSVGRTYSATDTKIVNVSASLTFVQWLWVL